MQMKQKELTNCHISKTVRLSRKRSEISVVVYFYTEQRRALFMVA